MEPALLSWLWSRALLLRFRPIGTCDFIKIEGDRPPIAVWRGAADPRVLVARSRRVNSGRLGGLDFRRLSQTVTIVREREDSGMIEHVVVAEGPRRLRLELRGDSVADGPVTLDVSVAGLDDLSQRILALRRLSGLWTMNRLSRRLHRPERVVPRLVMALHAWDAREAGATRAEIARLVFGENMVRGLALGDLRMNSLRKRVSRLLSLAKLRMRLSRERFLSGADES
ncbi:DUF2285 domain-containing protein [Glycocaulis profundi]|nr:DUF2285 domain-containing protein [Glycocaulis profundi]